MKPWPLIIISVLASCTNPSYVEKAPEIDILKSIFYSSPEDRATLFQQHYADDAQIYWNSTTPVTWKELLIGIEESLKRFDEFQVMPSHEIHLIKNSKGERWVAFWTAIKVRVGENEEVIPIHVSAQFVDLKIVKEAAYWDNLLVHELLNQ